ncbi:2OG-Fe(II) oxygenase family protein [Pelagibacteraceae bacterium]|nr:2OG-Fe(II) oxygenase family protein [Pelagibacteraceae bacterium]
MKVISPFGPKIAKLKFSSKLIKIINSEVDKIISKKKLINKFDYSDKLVGQVKQELQLPRTFIKKNLEKIIYNDVKKYINKSLGKKINNIKIKNFWVVRQFNNEYNPIHYHDGHVSGVGYLKVPKFITKSKKKTNTDGTIDFINGSKMFLNDSIYNHKPKVGDVLLFPNYLMHTAYPFSSEGERRSFSFNLEIDKNIANVFTK